MPKQIQHHISSKLQRDIMPRHPHFQMFLKIRLSIIARIAHISDPIVIVISTTPESILADIE